MLHELSTTGESSSLSDYRLTPYHILGYLYPTVCCVGFRFGTIQVFPTRTHATIHDCWAGIIGDHYRLLEITIWMFYSTVTCMWSLKRSFSFAHSHVPHSISHTHTPSPTLTRPTLHLPHSCVPHSISHTHISHTHISHTHISHTHMSHTPSPTLTPHLPHSHVPHSISHTHVSHTPSPTVSEQHSTTDRVLPWHCGRLQTLHEAHEQK